VVWYARSDGDFAGLTYERDQQVVGWHQHELGANDDGGLVKSMASIPGTQADEVWMIVERVINGGTVRTIEWLQPGLLDGDEVEDGIFLDASLTYDSTPADDDLRAVASGRRDGFGAGRWRGRVRTSWCRAARSPWRTRLRSSISATATRRPENPAHRGGRPRWHGAGALGRVSEIVLRLDRTVGGKFGPSDKPFPDPVSRGRRPAVGPDRPLFTGDKMLPFDGEWDRDRYVVIQQDQPLPMHVLGMAVSMRVSG
jgi:hypothetical protein